MVDRAAPRVVGGFLAGRDPAPLFELAASPEPLERRTAITAPLLYTRAESADDLATGFAVAAVLATDPDPVVHNAVGTFLKHAGERDRAALLAFLDEHAATMPRPAVRLAVAKLDPADRARFRSREARGARRHVVEGERRSDGPAGGDRVVERPRVELAPQDAPSCHDHKRTVRALLGPTPASTAIHRAARAGAPAAACDARAAHEPARARPPPARTPAPRPARRLATSRFPASASPTATAVSAAIRPKP